MQYFDYTFSITAKGIEFTDSHPEEMLHSVHIKPGDLFRSQITPDGRTVLVKLDPVYKLVVDD